MHGQMVFLAEGHAT